MVALIGVANAHWVLVIFGADLSIGQCVPTSLVNVARGQVTRKNGQISIKAAQK